MRILLFCPRGFIDTSSGKHVFSLAAALPPLGLASIAAVLRQAGHDVSLWDGALRPSVTNAQWAQRIAAYKPDFACFSAVTSAFDDAHDVCRRVKELQDSIRTVFGGAHVSWGREQILARFQAVDYVVAGEGEFSLLKLVEGRPPETIEGLYYRDGPVVRNGPPQEPQCSMDDLPFPAYDMLDGFPGAYRLPLFNYRRHPGASVISSRGCVYRCSYCDRSVFRRSFRHNSPEYTFELVQWLRRDFGIRHVIFYDDLFTLDRNRVARLCGLLRSSRPGLGFNCIVRVGHIDKELVGELKSAGCWMVNVGIESGDQDMLDIHKEGLALDMIRRDIELLHNAGLWVKGLFMVGFPGETEQSIRATIDFACSLPLKDANVTAFTPFPGAPVFKGIESLGAFENDWSRMDCVNFVFVPKEIGSRQALERYYAEFIRRFYRRPFARRAYRRMFLESPHSYWRLLRHAAAFLGYASSLKK